MENDSLTVSVSELVALTNQTLEYAYPSIQVVGEVSSFKVNQSKFVFFDLKDGESSVGCFMTVFSLRMPIEDGMKVIVRAAPKLTKWGKYSLTIQQIRPVGAGNLKKSFELLKAKLSQEGLFTLERKRLLPRMPQRIGVISSVQAAGYADFMKIIEERWGGMHIEVAHVQVQGEPAADQMMRALDYFNQVANAPEVIVIIRGGGSSDDLAAFNDEQLVRRVVASRVPVLTGIGHEVDQSLVDMAADVAASTPSNAAERLVPDKAAMIREVTQTIRHLASRTESAIDQLEHERKSQLLNMLDSLEKETTKAIEYLAHQKAVLRARDPHDVLQRGYAILRGKPVIGQSLELETATQIVTTEVKDVREK